MRARDWCDDPALRPTTAPVGGTHRDHLPSELQAVLGVGARIGNRATATWLAGAGEQNLSPAVALQRLVRGASAVQREDGLETMPEAEELRGGPPPRTQEQARALVDGHVVPRDCFVELESTRAGWRPITGTGCAHWVAHQRGGPTGTTHVCQLGFKYRVTELLATSSRVSADLQGAAVGAIWSANGSSHVGIVRAVTRDDAGAHVVSVQVENDSSASGGVVTQTKTDGSIYS